MRLIDADKIRYRDMSDGNVPAGVWYTFMDDIQKQPTVEAIPVEYIEITMNRWKEIIGYEESVDALRILIDNWKVERREE